jgi:hypothetical protein
MTPVEEAIAALDAKKRTALDAMRANFSKVDGVGLPMNDSTFLRYLRAR